MTRPISMPVKRVDNRAKTSGQAQYVADMQVEGMLCGRFVRSPHARARILGVDIPELPKDCHVISAADVPGENVVALLLDDWPVFADGEVKHVGEPVVLVVGPDPAQVADLAGAIRVAYEELPAALTLDEAGEDDIQADYAFKTGDPDAAFAAADRIIEGDYETGSQEHVYLETQGMLAIPRDGGIEIHGSMQCPYYVLKAVKRALGWTSDQVRILQTATGGAFGGKEDFPSSMACQVAVAAVTTGRPVRVILERDEDIQVTCKRHPSKIHVRTAHDATGRPTAIDLDVTLDGGAYAGLSPVVLQRSMFIASGVYAIDNIACRGKSLATNNVVSGAFRGFGGPQGLFAVEMHMERVARELGEAPVDFKQRHFVKTGDRTATGGRYHSPVIMDRLATRLLEIIDGHDRDSETHLRGIGHAFVLHGAGFTGSGERDVIKARVQLRRDAAAERVEILVASVEMGQGLQTALCKIVAGVLGLPLDRIDYAIPDTARVPDSGPTAASRSVMVVGKLVEKAARQLRSQWRAEGELTVTQDYEHPDRIQWDHDVFAGDAYPDFSWGAVAVQVAVDRLTGELDIEHVWAVHDVGVAIDQKLVQGQVEGGILQGLGWASLEVLEQEGGRLRQGSMTDYIIPTACDAPPVTSELLDNPSEMGPFGAKGAGELVFVGAPIALASAVGNALDIEINKLPIRPEGLLKSLEGRA